MAGIAFDKYKFSLLITSRIVFKISTKIKGMSWRELSNEFDLRQKTCWAFKRKIQKCMSSSKIHKITNQEHIDEFYIGQYEEKKVGRSTDGNKKLVIVALEILEGIPFSSKKKNASPEAFISTLLWRSNGEAQQIGKSRFYLLKFVSFNDDFHFAGDLFKT